VSAFYVTNRQEGYVLSGCILTKSKFYGNSLSAVLDGSARLVFLNRGEEYIITMPYAHCKGEFAAAVQNSSVQFSSIYFSSSLMAHDANSNMNRPFKNYN